MLKIENVVVPKEWAFSKEEEEILQQLQIDNCESLTTENFTISQSEFQEWFEQKKKKQNKNKITSSNAHKVLNRQKKFRTLTENLFVKIKKCSNIGQETLNHGNKFESTARQIYIDVMKFKLKHNFLVRETSVVIQPLLYWLAASPDGLQMKVTLPYLD